MASKPTLYRASMDLTTEGRELLGVALNWDVPALVKDPGRAPYWEAFTRSSCDESIRRNPEPRPLWYFHEYQVRPAAEPLGVANFVRSETSLLYRAFVSRTRRGDEMLELVNDKAARDVSIGFAPLQATRRQAPEGLVTVRTEIALNELSLAPTGKGMHSGKVLAVRALDPSFNDIAEAVSDALEAMLWPTTGEEPADQWVYVCDMGDTWAVYSVGGQVSEEVEGLWRITYTQGEGGTVTLTSEPEAVTMDYVPDSTRALDEATGIVPATAEETAAVSETPNLDRLKRLRRREGF